MKVYYLAPHQGYKQHQRNYACAINSLKDLSVNIIDTEWFAGYENTASDTDNSSKYYERTMEQITDADVTIFDATVSSMSIGHQMTYALQLQKPTLLLVNSVYRASNSLFIAGSKSPFLTVATYETDEDIKAVIKKFVARHTNYKGGRLNLALDYRQQKYLVWAAYHYRISKTDLVKRAIDNTMHSDTDYHVA